MMARSPRFYTRLAWAALVAVLAACVVAAARCGPLAGGLALLAAIGGWCFQNYCQRLRHSLFGGGS